MKKFVTLTLLSLLMVTVALFSGCKKDPIVLSESDDFVVINVETDKTDLSLAEYMASLTEYQDMFVIENGMVMAINGLYNDVVSWSASWMLYTNDAELSNTAWGTCEYQGEIYGSAMYGAESLTVKNGCRYIWVYQTF